MWWKRLEKILLHHLWLWCRKTCQSSEPCRFKIAHCCGKIIPAQCENLASLNLRHGLLNLSFQRLEYLKSAPSVCELPASSAPPCFFQLSAESWCVLFFYLCVSVCVIGPNFLLQFSCLFAQLPALACCSLVKPTRLKSASCKAAGGSAQACVMN